MSAAGGFPSLASRFWATPDGAEWAALFVGAKETVVAGRLSEVTLGGTIWLRLEIPDGADGAVRVRIFASAHVRIIEPCSEAAARAVAALQPRSTPLGPAAPGPSHNGDDHGAL